jgi:hypothetical protein
MYGAILRRHPVTEKKNFTNQDTPSIIDTEYRNCNFAHSDAVFDDPNYVGHRLFPGDNTPRTFIHCNLTNCEPPPGSTIVKCNTAIIRTRVFDYQDDPIEIDGETVTINHYKRIVVGKRTESGYTYITPKEYPFEEEA